MSNDLTPPVDPLSLYDVAMTTDRVLKVKRALEAAGLICEITTTISVGFGLDIRDPKTEKPKEAKRGRATRKR